jgi:hypothetical protein
LNELTVSSAEQIPIASIFTLAMGFEEKTIYEKVIQI